MKNAIWLVVFFGVLFVLSVKAQFVSPIPVADTDMRDMSSAKRRSLEIDRVKRDASKPVFERMNPASVNNFLEIKADFEKIQTSESDLIKTYKTGKQIDYAKIGLFSGEILQSSGRLKTNLFLNKKTEQADSPENAEENLQTPEDVPRLIVALDAVIGEFVNNPIFSAPKKAKDKDAEVAELKLERIIVLSDALKKESEKLAVSKTK